MSVLAGLPKNYWMDFDKTFGVNGKWTKEEPLKFSYGSREGEEILTQGGC